MMEIPTLAELEEGRKELFFEDGNRSAVTVYIEEDALVKMNESEGTEFKNGDFHKTEHGFIRFVTMKRTVEKDEEET